MNDADNSVFSIQRDAIERIIAAVCKADPRLASTASKIDRLKFALDMKVCPSVFSNITKLGSHATAKKRQQSLDRIKQCSTRLHGLLNSALADDWLRGEVSLGLALPSWQPAMLISVAEASLEPGEELLRKLLVDLNALARAKPFYPVKASIELSGFEYFAGVYLPDLFQQHFGRAATRRRDPHGDASVEGGVIAFATAVMRECHITKRDGSPYAEETISRAMTLARQPNRRRKRK